MADLRKSHQQTKAAALKKLLVVTGPTATGKTRLACQLARLFPAELISVDSRQVYQKMDIVTGKDLPPNSSLQYSKFKIQNQRLPYYLLDSVVLWGLDLVKPDQPFSAAHFVKFVFPLIQHLWQQKKLPCLVGGTGFWLRALLDGLDSLGVPPDSQLRHQLSQLSLSQLQKKLKTLNPHRFHQLNSSDRQNPRRLIRAIELSLHPPSSKPFLPLRHQADVLVFVLTAPSSFLYPRIDQRVLARLEAGALEEARRLFKKYSPSLPSLSGLGYPQLKAYLDGQLSLNQAVRRWQLAEHGYARRQKTWFKKFFPASQQPGYQVYWVDVSQPNFALRVAKLAKKWYLKTSQKAHAKG